MAALIRRGLREEGMAVDVAERGEDALWMAGSTEFDAIVLDVMLPGIDGFETCKRLRDDGVWSPVLMLTARDAVEDRVAGLDGGADDYLAKPFSFAELLARLRALARRGPVERPVVTRGQAGSGWTPPPGRSGAAATRSRYRPRSSPCSRPSCAAPARCSRASSCSSTPGTTSTRTARTSSTSTFATCARRSTSPSRPTPSRPCGRRLPVPQGAGLMLASLSIRARLTAAFAAAMILVLVMAGPFVYLKVRSDLTEALEESLGSRADDVAALVSAAGASTPDLGGERLVDGEDSFAQVIGPDGEVVASTLPASSGAAITPTEAQAAAGPSRSSASATSRASTARRGFSRARSSAGRRIHGRRRRHHRGSKRGPRRAHRTRSSIGGPVAILLASLLGYLLAGRAMAPVESMRRRAAEITLERSGERLPLPRADDELAPPRRDAERDARPDRGLARARARLRRGREPRAAHAAGDPADRARAGAAPRALGRRAARGSAIGGRGGRPARAPRRGPAGDRAHDQGRLPIAREAARARIAARACSRPLRAAGRRGGARDLVSAPAGSPGRARPDAHRAGARQPGRQRPAPRRRRRSPRGGPERGIHRARGESTQARASPTDSETARSSASAAPTRGAPGAARGSAWRSSEPSPRPTAATPRRTAAP